MSSRPQHIVRITEPVWREAADRHAKQIREILQPGLTLPDHVINTGRRRRSSSRQQLSSSSAHAWCTALDPKNPVYNFLIEYYGLKGAKGPKRLARWSPNPALVFLEQERITSVDELLFSPEGTLDPTIMNERRTGGVLLEGTSESDVGGVLHLRGSVPVDNGIVYSPASFFSYNENVARAASPYQWYQSVLRQTLQSEPVLHCHGGHEWAMQYQPEGAHPPPSAKYQSHLPLRVSRDIVNETVERNGIACTHVDALRYFAPAAGPLNHHGATLQRMDQLRLEQKGCVHAHMDLLKIALRLQPFVDAALIQRVLKVALESRRLDVSASPYDATAYGVGVVPVETEEGRKEYRRQQVKLMERAEPVRRELLNAYDLLLSMASDDSVSKSDVRHGAAAPERFAKAEPGGPSWRRNLIESTQ